MPQFFIKSSDIKDSSIVLKGDDCHHLLNVRRIKTGDRLMLRGDDGRGFTAEVINLSPEEISVSIISEFSSSQHLPDITLYMALLKSGNFEFVIQKAVEIGVNRIIPVITERTVPDPSKMTDKKNERWIKIASEAAKQCFRETPACVEPAVYLSDILKLHNDGLKMICHPGAPVQMKDHISSTEERIKASVIIGPEGGFSVKELSLAENAGWTAVNFGLNHLRAETAAIIIPSIIIYEWSIL